jgi:hypothetical protein
MQKYGLAPIRRAVDYSYFFVDPQRGLLGLVSGPASQHDSEPSSNQLA